jgi:predicted PurR-regulated permease PerM
MLDTIHITLIITAILLLVVCYYLYRAKENSNHQLDKFKKDILEKQSTSYISNVTTETYEIQRIQGEKEIPITWSEEQVEAYAKHALSEAIGKQLFQQGHIRFFTSTHNEKQFIKSTFEFATTRK